LRIAISFSHAIATPSHEKVKIDKAERKTGKYGLVDGKKINPPIRRERKPTSWIIQKRLNHLCAVKTSPRFGFI
jgi:hypothetical protein